MTNRDLRFKRRIAVSTYRDVWMELGSYFRIDQVCNAFFKASLKGLFYDLCTAFMKSYF